MNRSLKILFICIIALVGLYFMPFITTDVIGSNHKTYRAPFGVSFIQDDGEYVCFSSIRSGYALSKDAKNALYSYGETECYGKKYYYDSQNDISYDSIDTKLGLISELRYHYVNGNACEGWTKDDEIAWPFGKIEEVDLMISKEAALEAEWLVIENGSSLNPAAYNNFSRLVKQGVPSYFRAIQMDEENSLVDIQLLTDGKFKVLQRDSRGIHEEIYARLSEVIDENGLKNVSVYKGHGAEEAPIILFKVQ